MNWKEIQPDLAMIADYINQIYAIFMVLILAALAFGIVNTMLMAVLERTRELGMLAAIGMNRRRVFMMIMLESIFLSIVGGVAGMAVSGIVIAITGRTGINLVKYSEGMEAFGYSAHLLSFHRCRVLCHTDNTDCRYRHCFSNLSCPEGFKIKSC